MKIQNKKYPYIKLLIILSLLVIVISGTYYFHVVLKTGAVIIHLFYIPIVLAAFWWKRKGLIVAIFLAVILLMSRIFLRIDVHTLNDYIRALVFLLNAIVVAVLSTRLANVLELNKNAYEEINQIFDSSDDGMFLIDREFNILRINEKIEKLYQIKKMDALHKKCYEIFQFPFCNTPKCFIKQIIDGKDIVQVEIEIERNNKKENYIKTATPFRSPDGKLVGVVENLKNISDIKKLQKQMMLSEKLSAVGQLAAGVAHEFNNILAIILGRVQLLMIKSSVDKQKLDRALKVVEDQINRGANIVNDLNTFAKPHEPDFKSNSVSQIMKKTIKIVKDQFSLKSIKIISNYKERSKVMADYGMMQQVFLNLLINARDAILLSNKEKGIIKVSVNETGKQIKVSIIDNGTGMDEEVKNQIFSPFFTTKGAWKFKSDSELKGTGLGLAITHTIIKQHKGNIVVESQKGKGAVFEITLPVVSNKLNTKP